MDAIIFVIAAIAVYIARCAPPEIDWFYEFYIPNTQDVPDLDKFNVTGQCHVCPKVYLPVCGDDNVTYISECRLACANANKYKKDNKVVKMVRRGPCRVFPTDYT